MNKVSILLAVYNGENYISECIKSVINQSFKNWELIIVDNGSTDNTIQVVKNLTLFDARIFLYSLTEKGKCKAYNYAFQKSNGDFICFLAADDTLTEDSIELRTKPILNKSGYTTCLLKTFSDNPKFDGLIFPRNVSKPNLSGGSILFTRDIANKIFPIPEILPNEDTWTSISLEAFSNCNHIPKVLYNYRIHSSNSFGYNLNFSQKRMKYIERMNAYILFRQKWDDINNLKFNKFINSFIIGLNYCKNKDILGLILLKNLNFKNKLIFIYYSSSFLFQIRNKYFKFFSGFFN